ncbi:hypothetical protein HK098_004927, partial [Nowakowskiella sp. JEL0407]
MNEEPTLKEKALERLLETSRVRASSVNTPPISSSLLEKPLTSKHQHLKDDQYRHTQETLIQQQKNSDNYTSKNGEKIEQREAKAVILENPKVPLYLDRYIVTKVLGEGSYGRVKLATDAFTGEKVALKVFQKATIKKMVHITRIKREVYIMRLLNHPNIVKLYDVMETEKEIILSMEYINGGELFDYIVAQKRVKERMARRFFRQIVSALDYCHKSCIIHRDLKPENLLLDQDRNIRIIDFGFVNLFDPGDVMKTFCGSPYYASPEMIGSKKYIGPEVDIWSLGVILFALLAGHLPFRDSNTAELYKKISSSSYEIPEYFSKESRDLIKRMLTVDPHKRASIDEIKSHIWTLGTSDTAPEDLVPPRPIPKSLSEIDMGVVSRMAAYGFDTATVTQQILNCGSGSGGSGNGNEGGGVVSPPFALYCLLREQDERERKLEVHSPKTKHGAVIVEKFAGDGGAAEYAELDKSKGKDKDSSEKSNNTGIGVGDYVLENAALDLVPVTYQATSGSGNGESVTSTPNVRKHRAQVERQSSTGEHSSRDGSPTPIGTVSKKQTSLSRKSSSRRKEDTSLKPDEESSNSPNSNDSSNRKHPQQQQDLLSVVADNPRGVSPVASPRARTRPTSFVGTISTPAPSGGSRQRSITNTSDTSRQHSTANYESNNTIFTTIGTQNQDQYEQSDHSISRREPHNTVIPSQLQQPPSYLSARVSSSRRERSISSPPVSNVNYNINTHIDTIPIPQHPTTTKSKEMSGSALKLPQLNKSRNGSIVSMRSQDGVNSPTSAGEYTPQTIDQVIQKRESTQFRASTSSRPVSTYDEYSKRELRNSTTDSPALKKSSFKEAFKNTFKKFTKSAKRQSSTTSPKNSGSNESSISSLVSSAQSSVQSLSPGSGNSGMVGSQQHLQQSVQLSNANLQQPPTSRPRGTVRARPVSYHAGQKPVQGFQQMELANFMGPISSNDEYSSKRSLVKNSPLGVNVSSQLGSSKDGISQQQTQQQKSKTSSFKKDKEFVIKSATGGGILSAETTSTLQPESIIMEIERVMVANGIRTSWNGYRVSCVQADVEFEIELCRVKNTYLVGLEFRRVHGSVWAYQSLCRSLMQQW